MKQAWGVLWRSSNRLEGQREYLLGNRSLRVLGSDEIRPAGEAQSVVTFETRSDARSFIQNNFGYIKDRPDLRAEPHGWKMPQAVRVSISVERI